MATKLEKYELNLCVILESSIRSDSSTFNETISIAVADPEFKLRRGPGFSLLAQPAFLPSVISSFFTQRGGGRASRAPPLNPPLHSASSLKLVGVALLRVASL